MKLLSLLFILLSVVMFFATASSQPALSSESQKGMALSNLSSTPLAFTENRGQWDENAIFKAEAGGATFWFCKDEVVYQFLRDTKEIIDDGMPKMPGLPEGMLDRFNHPRYKKEQMVLKAQFVGANTNPEIITEDRLSYNCNFFYGNDPSKWATDVPNYSSITYKDIYPGIDLTYHGDGKGMKYDFIINPGADISQVRVKYDGVENLSVTNQGDLEAQTKFGPVYERIPQIYQEIDGQKSEISGHYILQEDGVFGFAIESSSNPAYPVVIDPELVYSTYVGDTGEDDSQGIAVDASGNAYVTGYTGSFNFPTLNPFQTDQNTTDVIVTKFSTSGNSLVYSTYLGGDSGESFGCGIAVDGSGNAYVTGYTYSIDFPIQNPYQSAYGGGSVDVFVTKLSPLGNSLVYSTYLGGNGSDFASSIAVDGSGNAYVTGATYSNNFPTQNPYDGSFNGDDDVFLTKFSTSGNSLVYSTFIGGIGWDDGYDIAVDDLGYAYVTGYTYYEYFPTNFPTTNAYFNSPAGGGDSFVLKMSATGNSLIYSTFLGGSNGDWAHGIATDGFGNAYIVGYTYSTDFPTTNNAFDNTPNHPDQGDTWSDFVTKFSTLGDSLIYSTYLGTSISERHDIALDEAGNAYIIGSTASAGHLVVNPYDSSFNGIYDVFVVELSSSGDSLLYGTFFGGSGDDEGFSIALNASDEVFLTGWTNSPDFPTINAYDSIFNGGTRDVFVAKFASERPPNSAILGSVTDMSMSPINDAIVTDINQGRADTTDAGAYALYELASGLHSISFAHPDFYDTVVAGIDLPDSDTISVNMIMRAKIYGALAGVVTDSSFNPIAGATITDHNQGSFSITDTLGHFILNRLLSGPHALSVTLTGYRTVELHDINIPENDTLNLNIIMAVWHPDVTLWFGNSDGSPLIAPLVPVGSNLTVDLYIKTAPWAYISSLHIPLAALKPYIDGMLGTTYGQSYEPLNQWHRAQFLEPYDNEPDPSWISQSFAGLADTEGVHNTKLHFDTPTRILSYVVHIPNNSGFAGDTIQCLGLGNHPQYGGMQFGDSTGATFQDIAAAFSPVYFTLSPDYGSIIGRVTDDNGLPLDSVQITVAGPTPGQYNIYSTEYYEIPYLFHGQYNLTFSSPLLFYDTTISNVNVVGFDTTILDVVMRPYASDYGYIQGSINSIYGPGIAGVQINTTGPTPGQYSSDENGHFFIPYIFHGQYDLAFSHPQYHDTTISNVAVIGFDTTGVDVVMRFESPPDVIFWIGNLDGSPIAARVGGPLAIDVYAMTSQSTYGGGIHFPLGLSDNCFDSLISQNRGQYYYPFTQWDLAEYQEPNGSPPNPLGWSSQSFLGWADLSGGPNPWLHLNTPTKILTFAAEVADDPALIGNTIHCLQIGQHPTLGGLNVTDTLEGYSFSNYAFISPITFEAAPDNEYLPGDVNMYNGNWPPSVIGGDLTYLVNYFIGNISIEPCMLGGFWASADANGDCFVNGGDVTKLVNYFRGIGGSVRYCPDHEPLWHDPGELPPQPPPGWPNCHEVLLGDNPLNGSNEGGR